MKVIFSEPGRGFNKLSNKLKQSFLKVLKSNSYILGKNVREFEDKIASYLNDKGYFVSCANGTDAITLSILALGIKPKSKVLVPSHTAPASIIGIINANCTPVYVDIEKNTPLINIDNIVKISKKIKVNAVLAVHLYGMCVDIKKLIRLMNNKNIKIIEDCSQSFGSRINGSQTGTLGNAGTFSFFPTKNLNTLGDAGGIFVKSKKIKDRIIKLRQYGWNNKRIVTLSNGINSRLDEIHAAILIQNLVTFDKKLVKKNNIADIYRKNLNNYFSFFNEKGSVFNSYHLLVVKVDHRDELIKYLGKYNIHLGIHYKVPCHQNGLLTEFKKYDLKNTEYISKKIVSLPMFPDLKKKELIGIIALLNHFGKIKLKNVRL